MENTVLSRRLKAVIIALGVLGALVYCIALPLMGMDMVFAYPEFSDFYWPWLIFFWASGVPCYLVLIYGWMVTENIAEGHPFTHENAKLIKRIAQFAIWDTVYFLIGNVILFLLGMSHPGIVLLSFAVVLAGVVFSIVASALSSFVTRASNLQEQSDLTI